MAHPFNGNPGLMADRIMGIVKSPRAIDNCDHALIVGLLEQEKTEATENEKPGSRGTLNTCFPSPTKLIWQGGSTLHTWACLFLSLRCATGRSGSAPKGHWRTGCVISRRRVRLARQ